MAHAYVLALSIALSAIPGMIGRARAQDRSAHEPASSGQALAFDPRTPIASRIQPPRPEVIRLFTDEGAPAPTAHPLTDDEQRRVSDAIAALPPAILRALSERLRTLSFVDGLPNTALTSSVEAEGPHRLFDLTVRAGVLRETASQFLTSKERTLFDTTGSSLQVAIEAGTADAILYVLLHEGTHMLDRGAAAESSTTAHPPLETFASRTWVDPTTMAERYRDPLLESTVFRRGGKPLPVTSAIALYTALGRTPFASVYGCANRYDDIAETVAIHHLTTRLHQPYRIVVRDGDREVFAYEPMTSPLVRERMAELMEIVPGS